MYTPAQWALEAAEKHGWSGALRIALQCGIYNPFFIKVADYIKAVAPADELEEIVGKQ